MGAAGQKIKSEIKNHPQIAQIHAGFVSSCGNLRMKNKLI